MPFSIAIPSSLVSEIPHQREKTSLIGQIGRAASIFRVDKIYIYPDHPDESRFIKLILDYMETPQYLRKYLFKRRKELKFAGVLPPLRTPNHPTESRASMLKKGDVREGVVLTKSGGEFMVDVGVDRHLKAFGRAPSIGGRAIIRITETAPELKGVFIGDSEVEDYWGFDVHVSERRLGEIALDEKFELTIATSRLGTDIRKIDAELASKLNEVRSIFIAFGSPRKGLKEILSGEGLTIDEAFHYTLNMVPEQGCESVRTEEAIYSTLAILNLLCSQ
ncbi:methylase [Candidatus Bathyarchaeota archaeon]|nr:methylase [Candidatus Bathyarchaeota archaeon]MBS7631080.1 methylase [Candidatus Bathyarchaeota archaeon]